MRTCCRTNCCGTSLSPTCSFIAALRHPRLVTDLSERGETLRLDKSSWAYFFYEYAGIPGTRCAAGCRTKSSAVTVGPLASLYDTGDHRDYRLLDEPGGQSNVDMICMIVIGFLIYGPVM